MARFKKKKKTTRKYTRRIKTTEAPTVTEKTLGESIIEQMTRVNETLATLVLVLRERQTCGGKHTTPVEQVVLNTVAAAASLPAEAPRGQTTGMEPPVPPKRRGRPPKIKPENLGPAEAARDDAGTVLEKAAEGEPDTQFDRSVFPKACACGVREDLPAHLHSKHCPVHGDGKLPPHMVQEPKLPEVAPQAPVTAPPTVAADPVEVKPPSMDDVRGLAIAFIGQHGKEKLSEVLASFGCEMLSGLKAEDRAPLMAKLQGAL